MPKALKNCPAGHRMTTDNTYWHNKHGNAYAVCRLCKQVQAKERKKHRFTKADQKRISQLEVVTEDITGHLSPKPLKRVEVYLLESPKEPHRVCLLRLLLS